MLLGAVGGPKWDHVKGSARPEAGLLGIRKALGVFANLRPAVIYPELKGASPLKDGIIEGGVDVLVVRELIGGIYFGERGTNEAGTAAYDTEAYTVEEITRIAASLLRRRANAPAGFAVWIKPMCWIPRAFGERRLPRWLRSIRTLR